MQTYYRIYPNTYKLTYNFAEMTFVELDDLFYKLSQSIAAMKAFGLEAPKFSKWCNEITGIMIDRGIW